MDRGDGTFIDQAPYSVVLNTLKSSKNVEINEWEAGKHYFYNVIFGAADEIQISPSVKEWDDVTAENISATKGGNE